VRRALGSSILEVTSRERRNLAIALRDGGELIGIWATNWRARRRSWLTWYRPTIGAWAAWATPRKR